MANTYSKGDKWNSLTLVSDMFGGEDFKSTHKSIFVCDCGLTHFATLNNVSRGVVKHCQACSSKRKSKQSKSHGHTLKCSGASKIDKKCYYTWQAMKRRCYTPSEKSYYRYGGRGISVCERWRNSYENFVADMGLPPTKDHQIDRIDNDGHYEPSNCRWVTREENGRNKRNNNLISAFGHTMTLSEWAQVTGLKRETIARRLEKGAHPEDALDEKLRKPGNTKRIDTPYGLFETISDCSRATGLSVSTIHGRLKSDRKPEWYVVA